MKDEKDKIAAAYQACGIAEQQRQLVDRQLLAMKAGHIIPHFEVAKKVIKYIQKAEGFPPYRLKLLDAGCGSAYYWEIFEHVVPSCIDYTGVDYNPGMVAMAQYYYPGILIFQQDITNLAIFNSSEFQIVFSGACIIHMPEWKRAIIELCRVSANWLILHRTFVHDGETMFVIKDAYGVDARYYTFNKAELINLVEHYGFKMVEHWLTGEGINPGNVTTFLFQKKRQTVDLGGRENANAYRINMLQPATAFRESPGGA